MSRVRYFVILVPLLSFLTPVHQFNTVLWPALAGAIYGILAKSRRELLVGLLVALGSIALVLVAYAAINAQRLANYLILFPQLAIAWAVLWISSFFLGSIITYNLRSR